MCVGRLTVWFEKKEAVMGRELGRMISLRGSFVYMQDAGKDGRGGPKPQVIGMTAGHVSIKMRGTVGDGRVWMRTAGFG